MTFATYPSLAGRVAFITGGASGIGADIVRAFARNGARVAFVDIQTEAASELAAELGEGGAAPLFLECNLIDIAALREAIGEGRAKLGPIAALVNNAANDRRHDIAQTSVEDWDTSQNINLRPHFFAAQAVRPHMRELSYGSIINLSSIAWRLGVPELAAYAAAKAGIIRLTRALGNAFGGDNIRVNAIEPGAVMTQRQRDLWYQTPESVEAMVQRQTLKTPLLGEDIARAALFLAADDSRMITRQSLIIDAGMS